MLKSFNPAQAYDLGLVKQIEVDGITADGNYDVAFVRLKKVEKAKQVLKACLSIYSNEKSGVRQKDVTVSLGSNLYVLRQAGSLPRRVHCERAWPPTRRP